MATPRPFMQKISMFILQGGVVSLKNTVIPTRDLAAGQAALVFTSTGVAFDTFTCIMQLHVDSHNVNSLVVMHVDLTVIPLMELH